MKSLLRCFCVCRTSSLICIVRPHRIKTLLFPHTFALLLTFHDFRLWPHLLNLPSGRVIDVTYRWPHGITTISTSRSNRGHSLQRTPISYIRLRLHDAFSRSGDQSISILIEALGPLLYHLRIPRLDVRKESIDVDLGFQVG